MMSLSEMSTGLEGIPTDLCLDSEKGRRLKLMSLDQLPPADSHVYAQLAFRVSLLFSQGEWGGRKKGETLGGPM